MDKVHSLSFLTIILLISSYSKLKGRKRKLVSVTKHCHLYSETGVVLTRVSHMISLQPLIPICPCGDVSKRTAAALMDTLPWAPVHPFHPSMPLSPQSRIMSLSEIQLRDPGPVVCSAAHISFLPPLLKPPLAPELPGRLKKEKKSQLCRPSVAAVSAG